MVDALYQAYLNNAALDMADWQNTVDNFNTGYLIQDALLKKKNERITGYKVSLTSDTTQQMFNTNEPLYGQQVASRVLTHPATVSLDNLNEPLIEVELVFTAKKTLTTDMALTELLQNSFVSGGIEVPDARFKDWFPTLNKYLVVSDAAVGGYIVSGKQVDGNTLTVADLKDIHVDTYHNGALIASGDATEVLGNPLHALQWLVKKLAQTGKQINPGDTISAGTFFVPPKLVKGEYEAKFSGPLTQTTILHVE